MADTTFAAGTVIASTWLNDVNDHVYNGKSLDEISPINVKDPAYGAVGDGVTNDFAAITAAVAYAKTLTFPHLIIPNGTYALGDNTLEFDLPNGAIIDCSGEFHQNFKA